MQQSGISVWAKGQAFSGDRFHEGEAFAELLIRWFDGPQEPAAHDLSKRLLALNGHFAFMIDRRGTLFAAVDRLRSIPLFYASVDQTPVIGDDASRVRREAGAGADDPVGRDELLLTGFVTGRNTMAAGLSQLRSGEWLRWRPAAGGRPRFETHRYFRFCTPERTEGGMDDTAGAFFDLARSAFSRLIHSTKGRTLMLPLSGGYDSRFILTMLRRLGHDAVRCFTYGARGNAESTAALRLAAELDYPCDVVHYSLHTWRRAFTSDPWQKYLAFAHGLSSLPHVQDWPAVGALKSRGRVPRDAIFIPGHTGFIHRSPLRDIILALPRADADRLVQSILDTYFGLWDWSRHRGRLDSLFRERIARHLLRDLHMQTASDMAAALDCWEFEERQAKFIVNSVRCYEFWGYDWRLPITDTAFTDFWLRIPDRRRYMTFLDAAPGFSPVRTDRRIRAALKGGVKRCFQAGRPPARLDRGYRIWRNRYRDYLLHIYRWYGIHTPVAHLRMTAPFEGFRWAPTSNINSLLTRHLLSGAVSRTGSRTR